MFIAYELPSDFARVARAARVILAKGFFERFVSYKHCAPSGANTLQSKRFTRRSLPRLLENCCLRLTKTRAVLTDEFDRSGGDIQRTGQHFGFDFVHDQNIDLAQELRWKPLRGRRVQNHPRPGGMRATCERFNFGERDFELHDNDCRRVERGIGHAIGRHLCVGASDHGDGVLSIRVDMNQRHAGRCVSDPHAGYVDAIRASRLLSPS